MISMCKPSYFEFPLLCTAIILLSIGYTNIYPLGTLIFFTEMFTFRLTKVCIGKKTSPRERCFFGEKARTNQSKCILFNFRQRLLIIDSRSSKLLESWKLFNQIVNFLVVWKIESSKWINEFEYENWKVLLSWNANRVEKFKDCSKVVKQILVVYCHYTNNKYYHSWLVRAKSLRLSEDVNVWPCIWKKLN